MTDNIPYRLQSDIDTVVYMENYTHDEEFYIVTKPAAFLRDPNERNEAKFVTLVYCNDPIYEVILNCIEYQYTDTEEEAEKKHYELLDKWNYIQYSPASEVTDEEVQDWGLGNVFCF
jgi:hypothetical protein